MFEWFAFTLFTVLLVWLFRITCLLLIDSVRERDWLGFLFYTTYLFGIGIYLFVLLCFFAHYITSCL